MLQLKCARHEKKIANRIFTDYMSGNFDKSAFLKPVVASGIETEI